MHHSHHVLQLDIQGPPQAWISLEHAATHVGTGSVAWVEGGADEAHLGWTPLIRATALGRIDDMRRLLDSGAPLEDRDWWSRSAWLVALQVGHLEKAQLLRDAGADVHAVGRCAQPPLFYPIDCHRTPMLRWLLELGFDVEQTNQFGTTPLIHAVESGHREGIELLLNAGAQIGSARSPQLADRAPRDSGNRARVDPPPSGHVDRTPGDPHQRRPGCHPARGEGASLGQPAFVCARHRSPDLA